MKNISCTDLQLIPELAHLRMLDFIDPANDALIAPFLKVLGFDLDYPITYIPCQHRNMQGKVVIAYVIAGEVECNAAFLNSPWATMEDRIIVTGYRDVGLASEIANGQTKSRSYEGEGQIQEGFSPELTNPDEANILMQIKVLADLLLSVRGDPFKQDGSRKALDEHGIVETEQKRERARKKVSSKVAK